MLEQNSSSPETPKETASLEGKGHLSRTQLYILLAILSVAILGLCGYIVWESYTQEPDDAEIQPTPLVSNTQPSELITINYSSGMSQPEDDYLSYQIRFPSDYVAVSGDMMTYFRTQGGMAPPTLVLIKPTEYSNLYSTIASEGDLSESNLIYEQETDNRCLKIWNTKGFISQDLWYDHVEIEDYTIDKEETKKLGRHTFEIRYITTEWSSPTVKKTAFLSLGEDVTYFFETCDEDKEDDFESVLENFTIRLPESSNTE